jgi:hypothetical protein
VIAGATIVLTVVSTRSDGPSRQEKIVAKRRAEQRLAEEARERTRQQRIALRKPARSLLHDRDQFFTFERQVVAATKSAETKVYFFRTAETQYEDEVQRINDANEPGFALCRTYFDVPCPDPFYPDAPRAPEFTLEVQQLRSTATSLSQLQAKLESATPETELRALWSLLRTSVSRLSEEATHNADVLSEVRDSDYTLADGKVGTLRRDGAVPAIGEMNRAAIAGLRAAALPVEDFDVPGGRDIDPSDHSTLLPAESSAPTTSSTGTGT